MNYNLKPIDVSQITLNNEILKLTELLAQNIHDLWAQQRMNEGWVYGLKRDDDKKTHPCLIEYEQLPELEKEYDRITAINTLKVISALGYKIEKEKV